MLASAPPDHYGRALELLLKDDAVDSVLVIFIPPLVTDADKVAEAIASAASSGPGKPVCGIFMRSHAAPAALAAVPCYSFPEPAAIAMARVAAYGEWRRQPEGGVPQLRDLQPRLARRIVESALQRGGGWLSAVEANALLAAVGHCDAALALGHVDRRRRRGRCEAWLSGRDQGRRHGTASQDRAQGDPPQPRRPVGGAIGRRRPDAIARRSHGRPARATDGQRRRRDDGGRDQRRDVRPRRRVRQRRRADRFAGGLGLPAAPRSRIRMPPRWWQD